MKCHVAYEVSLPIKTLNTTRSVVFEKRAEAKKFKAKWPSATLKVVELCDGKIKRRGKRSFGARHRVRR